MIGVCEALLYGYRAGLDLNDGAAIGRARARPAAGRSRISGPRIIAGNFEPGFFVEHFIKDMGIALAEAKRMGLAMPGLALAHQLYRGAGRPGPRPRRHARAGTGPGLDGRRRLATARRPDSVGDETARLGLTRTAGQASSGTRFMALGTASEPILAQRFFDHGGLGDRHRRGRAIAERRSARRRSS